MHNNSNITIIKGAIGVAPPWFALMFNIDSWAAPAQWALGCIVPTLIAISLSFDIKKKWKEDRNQRNEENRQAAIKDQRRKYFSAKHKRKHAKNKKPDSDTGGYDPTDATELM